MEDPITSLRRRNLIIFAAIFLTSALVIHFLLQPKEMMQPDTRRTGVIIEIDPPRFRVAQVSYSVLAKDTADNRTIFVIHPHGQMDGCKIGDRIQFYVEGSRAIYVTGSCVRKI